MFVYVWGYVCVLCVCVCVCVCVWKSECGHVCLSKRETEGVISTWGSSQPVSPHSWSVACWLWGRGAAGKALQHRAARLAGSDPESCRRNMCVFRVQLAHRAHVRVVPWAQSFAGRGQRASVCLLFHSISCLDFVHGPIPWTCRGRRRWCWRG